MIMESGGIDGDLAPSRELEHGCLAGFVPNDDRNVLRGRLWDARYLGESQSSFVATRIP